MPSAAELGTGSDLSGFQRGSGPVNSRFRIDLAAFFASYELLLRKVAFLFRPTADYLWHRSLKRFRNCNRQFVSLSNTIFLPVVALRSSRTKSGASSSSVGSPFSRIWAIPSSE